MSKILPTFLMLVMLAWGFYLGFNWPEPELPIEPWEATQYLEAARDSHQYFVDNPDKIKWADDSRQDAEWVEIYGQIIGMIEVLGQ
ncbi:hypothetical protein LCGC14_0420250 [marine sediment metagenome]|uniref:Uncharacterized protein n=1 Tax=marine sediment metagenome TaxID=412755 RepID=A0A0F9VD07_9ZZZZ